MRRLVVGESECLGPNVDDPLGPVGEPPSQVSAEGGDGEHHEDEHHGGMVAVEVTVCHQSLEVDYSPSSMGDVGVWGISSSLMSVSESEL